MPNIYNLKNESYFKLNLLSCAQEEQLEIENPSNDFIKLQEIVNELGADIENELNLNYLQNRDILNSQLNEAEQYYTSFVAQVNNKYSKESNEIISHSFECYLKYSDHLYEIYSKAGNDFSICLETFDNEIDPLIDPAFNDYIPREQPMNLPNFIIKETAYTSFLVYPSISIQSLQARQNSIIYDWNKIESEFESKKAQMSTALINSNKNLYTCFVDVYVNFSNSIDDIITEVKDEC